jgi:hypothetical protein
MSWARTADAATATVANKRVRIDLLRRKLAALLYFMVWPRVLVFIITSPQYPRFAPTSINHDQRLAGED